MKWPGKAWIDSHPSAAVAIFSGIMLASVALYGGFMAFVVVHFIVKYW